MYTLIATRKRAPVAGTVGLDGRDPGRGTSRGVGGLSRWSMSRGVGWGSGGSSRGLLTGRVSRLMSRSLG